MKKLLAVVALIGLAACNSPTEPVSETRTVKANKDVFFPPVPKTCPEGYRPVIGGCLKIYP